MSSLNDLLHKLKGRKKKRFSGVKKEKGADPVIIISTGLIIALIVIILLIVFIIYPTILSINTTKEKINQNKDLLERLEQKNTNLKKAEQAYKAETQGMELLNYSIADDPEYINNLKILEKIAAETTASGANFVLLQVSLGKLPPYQEPTKTARAYVRSVSSYNLTFKADYTSTQTFLENVKKNLRNFTVMQLVFSSSGQQSGSLLDVSTRLDNIYYSPF